MCFRASLSTSSASSSAAGAGATNVALLWSAQSGLLPVMLGFALVNLPCILIWAALGDRLGLHLQTPWKRRLFNGVMALSLVATTLWMLADALR